MVGIKPEAWKLIFRSFFIVVLVSMYVTDRGFGLWKSAPTREEYLIVLSFALGLDLNSFRILVMRMIVPGYVDPQIAKDKGIEDRKAMNT